MTKQLSKGTCSLCHGEFSKATMTKHLEACQRRAIPAAAEAASRKPGRKTKKYHLVVEGRDLPMYWMHLEVSTGATLADLDQFLRASWLECCGHLSAFEIEKERYSSDAGMYSDWEAGEKSMRVRLDKVLGRNTPPLIPCGVCGKPATAVCSQCVYDEQGWLCEACAKTHECGEDMLLPVVNSPRVGMCGYTG